MKSEIQVFATLNAERSCLRHSVPVMTKPSRLKKFETLHELVFCYLIFCDQLPFLFYGNKSIANSFMINFYFQLHQKKYRSGKSPRNNHHQKQHDNSVIT